ncbi:MAG: hypothetical protein ACPGJS_15520 [Flammeovirgaceae bacterium]
MKQTKRLLKSVFGNKKEGLRYIKNMLRRDKDAPSLFVYSADGGSSSSEFLDWLATLASSHSAKINEYDFHKDRGHSDAHANVLIDGVHEVTDPLIEKVVKTRSKKKRIVIASKKRPKALDYVSDPSLLVGEVDDFDLAAAKNEIPVFLSKLA